MEQQNEVPVQGDQSVQQRTHRTRRKGQTPRRSRKEYLALRIAVKQLYRDSTFSLGYLARTLNLPHSTVHSWCMDETEGKARRKEARRSKMSPKDEVEILRLYEEELHSQESIAARMNLPRSQISRVILTHLSKAQRLGVANARAQKNHQVRISMIQRWVNGLDTFHTLERVHGISRSTMSGWVRRPDLPADLRAKVAEKLPGNHRRATKRRSHHSKRASETPPAPTTQIIGQGDVLTAHAVQAILADIGLATGYDVWVPAIDRGRVEACMGRKGLAHVWPAMTLPERLDAVVRNIDVTWLLDGVVTHCYEVEHSTAVTTGIARIRDAQEMFPNFLVNGYIVAKAGKKKKFEYEARRPSMGASASSSATRRPMAFIDQESLRAIGKRAASEWLRPDYVQEWLDQHASS